MPAKKKTVTRRTTRLTRTKSVNTRKSSAKKINLTKKFQEMKKNFDAKKVGIVLIISIFSLVALKYRYFIIPATVNGRPIFIGTYLTKLNKAAGTQVLSQMISENLIDQQAATKGITVNADEIKSELSKLEEQFADAGGLDLMLSSRGINREELNIQIALNLKVQKLLEDQITVIDEEIDEYYSKNEDFFKETSQEEAKEQIRENLKAEKLQQEVVQWLDQIRSQAKINIYLPGSNGQ